MSSKKRVQNAQEGSLLSKRRCPSFGAELASSPFAWTPVGLQVLLPSDQRLIFQGAATLTVHSGEVDIAGTLLTAGAAPLQLTTDAESPLLISVAAVEARVPLAGSGGAAFSLAGVAQPQEGFTAWLDGDSEAPYASEVPAAWRQAAAQVAASVAAGQAAGAPPAVILVAGPKKVGKSTVARYLTNVLLNSYESVAFFDTDCGQPEFSSPGLVSITLVKSPIVGPPHLHLRPSAAAHFIGDVSPSADPERYLLCVASLHSWYHRNLTDSATAAAGKATKATPPLVVNTHGWVKGFGLDIMTDMLRMLPVTHFLNMASPNRRRNLPQGAFWLESAEGMAAVAPPVMWELPGASHVHEGNAAGAAVTGGTPGRQASGEAAFSPGGAQAAPRAAVEQRALMWTAFARSCVQAAAEAAAGGADGCRKDEKAQLQNGGSAAAEKGSQSQALEPPAAVGDFLAAAPPYEVSFAAVAVRPLFGSLPPSQLAYALNGAIVGLCTRPESSNSPARCLGLGLVRAVDAATCTAFILTPVLPEALQRVAVLEVGRLELPPALLQTGSFMSPYLAMHSLSTAGTGAGTIKSRNNMQRAASQGQGRGEED